MVGCGTILVTSHGTLTNRWTMTIPMIPILFLHSCMYYYSITVSKLRLQQQQIVEPKQASSFLLPRIFLWMLTLATAICIMIAIALSALFPAVELPPLMSSSWNNTINNHHHFFPNIGVIDFYIPLPSHTKDVCTAAVLSTNGSIDNERRTCSMANESSIQQKFLPVRLLYPTHDMNESWWSSFRMVGTKPTPPQQGIPYLNIETAIEFCRHSMKFGAPKPLKQMDWILHTWRLITLPLRRNAPLRLLSHPNDNDESETIQSIIPPKLVVFSHGLGGTMDLYSYQTMSLASMGYIVLTMTHTDGTAPIVPQPYPYRHLPHDASVLQLYAQGKHEEYELTRQSQNAIRTHEYLYAVEYVQQLLVSLSSQNADVHHDDGHRYPNQEQIQSHNVEYHRKMLRQYWQIPNDETRFVVNGAENNMTTYFMGHSFGGATAIQAAYERPDLVNAIIAYEPAVSWTSPQVCHAIFPSDLMEQPHFQKLTVNYTVCPPTNNDDQITTAATTMNESETLHDFDMLVLNSQEWMNKNWGRAQLLQEMYQRQQVGRNPHISYHGTIGQSHHNEFSDTSMLTPLWLARPVGLTGPRNPIHTAIEIAQTTRAFLQRLEAHYSA